MKALFQIGWAIILLLLVFSATSMAEEIKFTDWVGVEEPDATSKLNRKKIGTYAGDGNSSLWLMAPASGADRIEMTLKSDRTIVSDYFSYQIDKVDTLALRSGIKGCNGNCLTDEVEKNGELIRTMRRGLRIKFEFDAAPDTTRRPTFSLRGFTRAYNWLLAE
ncbi:MAG: hypothetical protein PVG35_09995 [Desulfobacterales bacterium]|jgi:hypothetical protein